MARGAHTLVLLACLAGCADAPYEGIAGIGDFGGGTDDEKAVAKLIERWRPDYILTVGDNNYASELDVPIDVASYERFVGESYGKFITDDPATNRFWPTL